MKYWRRLDNAAKIFPSASNGHDTNVFRLYCELNEAVEHSYLQEALNKTIEEFPIYRSVMKRGLFWYYLEESSIKPIVKLECKSPCSKIYDKDVKRLLFNVTYFNNRINLEIYHVLADGTAAQKFLKVLVANYLCFKYRISSESTNVDVDASIYQKADDSYKKYYEKDKKKNNKIKRAYKIGGIKTSNRRLNIVEGKMSSSDVLEKAHEYNATITAFLTGILLKSIFEEMSFADRKKPVVVSVPVNLRNFFDSSSMRNFFGVIFVEYDFSKESSELKDIITYVDKFLKSELKKEKIKFRMNSLISVEKNLVIRCVPLILKNFILKIAFKITEMTDTTTVSNIGRVCMPDDFEKYIQSFGMFVATNKIQLGVCTYKDILTTSFSSCFIDTDIQMKFFRILTDMGIAIDIASNSVEE